MRLSSDITELRPHYQVLVVGSGYGGAVAASRAARAFSRVAVFERGREWHRDFPKSTEEVAADTQIDFPDATIGHATGLYEFRVSDDLVVYLGCGLGGGSLVNSGVAVEPPADCFDDPHWPQAFRRDPETGELSASLRRGFRLARRVLEPRLYPDDKQPLPKLRVLEAGARAIGKHVEPAPMCVSFSDGENPFHVPMSECRLCGECVSGCNYGAKQTLDTNYLADAWNHGAEIFTHIEVEYVERVDDAWLVHFLARDRDGGERIRGYARADRVMLAAGSFGSTGILLRSRARGLAMSPTIGARFTANGDQFGFAAAGREPAIAIGLGKRLDDDARDDAGNTVRPGPTIAGIIDLRSEGGPMIEDGTLPTALMPHAIVEIGRALHEVVHSLEPPASTPPRTDAIPLSTSAEPASTMAAAAAGGALASRKPHEAAQHADAKSLHAARMRLASLMRPLGAAVPSKTESVHFGEDDRLGSALDRTLTLLSVAVDDAAGELRLDENGRVRAEWPGVTEQPSYRNTQDVMRRIAEGTGGVFIPSPLDRGIGGAREMTVHPLGGCALADRGDAGVVNADGRVFTGIGTDVHDGLYVCDGSIVPVSLGTNPFLTISALAEHICHELVRDAGGTLDCDRPSPRRLPGPGPRVALRFSERMEGAFSTDERVDFERGAERGAAHGSTLTQELCIFAEDLDRMLVDPSHAARMVGQLNAPALAPEPLAVTDGILNVLEASPDGTGRRVRYRARLTSAAGRTFFLDGEKRIRHDAWLDAVHDNVTLFVSILDGDDERAPVLGRGVLRIGLSAVLALVASMRVENAPDSAARRDALLRFARFYFGEQWEVYVHKR